MQETGNDTKISSPLIEEWRGEGEKPFSLRGHSQLPKLISGELAIKDSEKLVGRVF